MALPCCSLACRCATKADEEGFTHFGLQYYGECWSSANAAVTFRKFGKSKNCANEFYGDCVDEEEDCVGRGEANFVYEVIGM